MKQQNNKNENLILALETAQGGGSVSLVGKQGVVAAREGQSRTSKAEELTLLVDDLLAAADVSKCGLAAIAVSNGPGSLTGIRVGIAYARGLADALEIPLREISILEALQSSVEGVAGNSIAAVNSGKNEISYRVFENNPQELTTSETSSGPIRIGFEEFVEFLDKECFSASTLIVTRTLAEAFERGSRKSWKEKNMRLIVPEAALASVVGFAGLSACRFESSGIISDNPTRG